jgi:diadenosine tetraphosphate (Ap4A) HIT family hydrolase
MPIATAYEFTQGVYTDAYLQRADVQPGYTLVIWRGRHVNEPTELDDAEASGYWAEVLTVARALISVYKPLKMNYETLGNSLPHLHTHLIPRFSEDPRPVTDWALGVSGSSGDGVGALGDGPRNAPPTPGARIM